MEQILPKITIVVPVYNVEKYVSKCLESIINQSYKNLEIIIVDDGATDSSGEICKTYAENDDRMILIHQENQGLSMARNNALDIATGEYVGFVDSDDWVEPDMYSVLYTNAADYGADISMCNFCYVSPTGVHTPFSSEGISVKAFDGVYKMAHNIRTDNNFVWNKLYKRNLFDVIRFPKGRTFEDILTMYKLIENANKVVVSSECKYYYLRRENSITLSRFNLKQVDNIEARIERYEYISAKYPNLEATCKKQIFTSVLWAMGIAYRDNCIETHREALREVMEKVRRYDFTSCGFAPEAQQLLKKYLYI